MQLEIDGDEQKVLRDALESLVSELGYEIANTDAKDYRDGLRARRELLRGILDRLGDSG